ERLQRGQIRTRPVGGGASAVRGQRQPVSCWQHGMLGGLFLACGSCVGQSVANAPSTTPASSITLGEVEPQKQRAASSQPMPAADEVRAEPASPALIREYVSRQHVPTSVEGCVYS